MFSSVPVPIIHSKHEQTDPNHEPAKDSLLRDSTTFSPSALLTFSGSNWDGLEQISPEVQVSWSTLTLWLVCSSDGKMPMSEGHSGGYGFDF